MALALTLATLKTAIQNHIENQGAAFSGNLNTLIQLGEDRVVKDFDLEIFDSEQDITLTINVATITKPSNTIAGRTLWYTNGSSDRVVLRQRTYEFIQDYWPTPADTGEPKFFCELTTTTWGVAPTPAATRTGKARCIIRPTSIVTDTAGTWVSLNFGDLLLRACLMMSEAFEKADDRIMIWKMEYTDLLAVAKREIRSGLRHDGSPLAPMPTTEGKPEK